MRDVGPGSCRGMEASTRDMRLEEARSRRLGAQEDAAAAEEEERLRLAKVARRAKRSRKHGNDGTGRQFVADCSEDYSD
jgi:SPT2 chromatin protein